MLISVINQKGGVGKSTISRALAAEFSRGAWATVLLDTDIDQATNLAWSQRRQENPKLAPVEVTTKLIDFNAHDYDLIIADGEAKATNTTAHLAVNSDLIIIPVQNSIDDAAPSLELASNLVELYNVEPRRILLIQSRCSKNINQRRKFRRYIKQTGFNLCDYSIFEKDCYKDASILGQAITETRYKSANESAARAINEIIAKFSQLIEE